MTDQSPEEAIARIIDPEAFQEFAPDHQFVLPESAELFAKGRDLALTKARTILSTLPARAEVVEAAKHAERLARLAKSSAESFDMLAEHISHRDVDDKINTMILAANATLELVAALASLPSTGGAGARDWVDCPICGESDMRREKDAETGLFYIHCVNLNCGSNGGGNFSALAAAPSPTPGDEPEKLRNRAGERTQASHGKASAPASVTGDSPVDAGATPVLDPAFWTELEEVERLFEAFEQADVTCGARLSVINDAAQELRALQDAEKALNRASVNLLRKWLPALRGGQ